MILADNIRYLRKKRGWSQDYLAEILGYKSYTTIQKWESGVSEPPLKKAHAIANLFGVDINDLTGVNIEESETKSSPDKIKQDEIDKSPTEKKLKLLARHLDKVPDEQRERLIKNFEDSIDLYLDALNISKGDE